MAIREWYLALPLAEMNFLDVAQGWVDERRAARDRPMALLQVRVTRARPKNVMQLILRRQNGSDVELLLWDSGEAELNSGTARNPTFRHIVVHSRAELEALLADFQALCEAATLGE